MVAAARTIRNHWNGVLLQGAVISYGFSAEMVDINYRVHSFGSFGSDSTKALSADEIDFRCFAGDVVITIGDVVFDAAWGWVPLVFFATSSLLALSALVHGETQATIYFTENQDEISLVCSRDSVLISATFNQERAEAPLNRLIDSFVRFSTDLFDEIIKRTPSLLTNSVILERLRLLDGLASDVGLSRARFTTSSDRD